MSAKLNGWMVLVLLLGTMVYAIAEELTLTTYYPSPRGVYNELRTRGDVAIGKLDTPSARLEIVGGGATSATSALRIRNVDGTALLEVQNGGNVGIGTTAPSGLLHVSGTSGGPDTTMKLEDPDTSGAVGSYFRVISRATNPYALVMYHGGSAATEYWTTGMEGGLNYQINRASGTGNVVIPAGNVGIGTGSPQAKLDVAGGIKIGNTSSGAAGTLRWEGTKLQVYSGTSWVDLGLQAVRGTVASNGSILRGSGFTVTRTSAGHYTVTFSTPFSTPPIVTATVVTSGARFIAVGNVTTASFEVIIADESYGFNNAFSDADFHFLAIKE